MLARCAGKDKFMPVVETLFAKQPEWMVQKPIEPLKAIAKQFGFTEQSFDACLANQHVLDGIQEVRTAPPRSSHHIEHTELAKPVRKEISSSAPTRRR